MRGRPKMAIEKRKLFGLVAGAVGGAKDVPTGMVADAIAGEPGAGRVETLRSRVYQILNAMEAAGLAIRETGRLDGTRNATRAAFWSLTPSGLRLAASIPTTAPRS